MVDIAGLTILVLIAWGALALGLILLKAMLWLVFLPIRLLFYALLLPLFFVLKAALGGVLLLVLAPLLAIAALLTLVAGLALATAATIAVQDARHPLRLLHRRLDAVEPEEVRDLLDEVDDVVEA